MQLTREAVVRLRAMIFLGAALSATSGPAAGAPVPPLALDEHLAEVLGERRTYVWLPMGHPEMRPPFDGGMITYRVQTEVDHHLEGFGFRVLGADIGGSAADFHIGARVEKERSQEPFPGRFEPGPDTLNDDRGFRGAEPGTAYDPAERLTAVLTLVVFDGVTGARLWRGWSSIHLDLERPYDTEPEELARRLRQAVEEILTDPVDPAASSEPLVE